MVQKVVTVYVDDLTGEESHEAETHTFALNGVTYEIDLTSDSYDQLADALGPFIKAGRKTGRAVTRRTKRPISGPTAEEVRDWAKASGLEVNDRGRVPRAVVEAYHKAH
ncbi:Lsr2 family protein [Streptomyces sp. NPDC051909]|uniref:histone-like nucleoid-structuring protein Lsr2 n=1 Tax=Streptomyces sp. NPDC051909 TaxID=3154944 RepID=UPI00341BA4AD